ncbi:MAG: hypothetical protein KDK36_09270 [Leptospiraceae bacterium]|nr:hypothetical protein [Leptospiraceae bacterium]
MKKIKYLFLPLIISFLAQCASPQPLPTTKSNDSGSIAMSITMSMPAGFPTVDPNKIYFLKVDPKKSIVDSKDIYVSNYAFKNRVYLFNVPPGDYVAIGGFLTMQTPDYVKAINKTNTTTASTKVGSKGNATVSVDLPSDSETTAFFSEELAKATMVKVEPGKMAFAGDVKVGLSISLSEADAVQKHAESMIKPGALKSSFSLKTYNYLGKKKEVVNSGEALEEFKKNASEKELMGSDYMNAF